MRGRQLFTWFRLNLAIPTTLMLVGVGLGAQAVTSEIDAGAYTMLADNWKHMSAATRQSITATLEQDGKIDQWRYKGLFEGMMHDAGAVVVPAVDYDRQSARERLLAITRHRDDAGATSPNGAVPTPSAHALARKD